MGKGPFAIDLLGFHYSSENVGAPWSNMFMMMLMCMTMGVICPYVMVPGNNVMYCAMVQGAVNVIGGIPVVISISGENGLLGPNPTGLIGMSGLILCAIIMFLRLPKVKEDKADKQNAGGNVAGRNGDISRGES